MPNQQTNSLDGTTAASLVSKALSSNRTALNEHEAKLLISSFGVPVVEEWLCATPAEAADRAASIDAPVVLKLCSPDIPHKKEMGFVKVGLTGASEVLSAAEDMLARATNLTPDSAAGATPHAITIDGLLIQRLARGERELLAGFKRDPVFGPCVTLGLGGIFTEVLGDISVRVAPLSESDALEMLHELKSARMFNSYRGLKPVDTEILAKTLIGLSRLALEHPEISEIDINPLIVGDDGLPLAVDALVLLAKAAAPISSTGLSLTATPREMPHPLDKILSPKSIAFLGASDSIFTMGTAQMLNVINGGFKGEVFPVHPKLKTVLGHKAYPSIMDLPDGIDIFVMVLPTKIVPEVLEQCGKKGITRGTVISGGFSEVGEEGRALEQQVREVSAKYGLKFNGPNCIGVVNPRHNYNNTWFPYTGTPGHIGLASQSGTYVCHTFAYIDNAGFGLSKGISVGNEVTLDLVDCLEYFEQDEDTKAIALYIEGIRRGPEFIATARRVAKKKPIVALYVGGTEAGARAGASHTAVLSGPDELYDGMFRQAGVLRARGFEELFDWAWVLSEQPPLTGPNVAILTNSGGPGSSMADAASRLELNIPVLPADIQAELRKLLPHTASVKNPVDLTFAIDSPSLFMKKIPQILFSSPEIHGLLMYGLFDSKIFSTYAKQAGITLPFTEKEMVGAAEKVAEQYAKIPHETGKPIVGTTFFTRKEDDMIRLAQDLGVPFLPSPERAASAMGALYRYGKIKARL